MPIKKNIQAVPVSAVVDTLDVTDLQKRLATLQGTAFIIIIGQEDGKFGLHYRQNNPCQGGHLRTYGSTHDDCTRPKDNKPGDLPQPFPDGKPVGLVYRYPVPLASKEHFEAAFSDASPWVSGFGGSENVILLDTSQGCGSYYTPATCAYTGFYIHSGNFDPTVLVNLMKQASKDSKLYLQCLERGLSVTEALTFCAFFHGNETVLAPSVNPYYFDPLSSPRRMVEQRVVDITGGTWGDRYAYNRPDMACVFRTAKGNEEDKKEKEINLAKVFSEVKSKEKLNAVPLDKGIEIFKGAISV